VALLVFAAPAEADKLEVNTTADHKPGKCTKRDCTLREAIIRANENDGGDKVRVSAANGPYELTRSGAGEDLAVKGDLDVEPPLEVVGTRGRAVIRQTAGDRIFHTQPGFTFDVSLRKLTLTGGSGVPSGGALLAEDQTFVSDSVIRDNRAGVGGGIATGGTDARLGITQTTITGNRATDAGGGLYLTGNDGVASGVGLSTVAGNRAPVGGGVYALLGDGDLNLNNSTVTENRAAPGVDATGGGVYMAVTSGAGVARLGHTTVASNEAPAGGGKAANLQALSEVQMENTIVADPVGASQNCTFDVESAGHNLDDGTTCGLDQGTDVEELGAGLKPLADNGGPTETMALKASSGALAGGTCPGTLIVFGVDQRGAGRPAEIQGLSCDIGAYERDPTSPPD